MNKKNKMLQNKLKYIYEPSLVFGNGQKTFDPRDGLMLFGPFDQKKINGNITVGVIGTAELRTKTVNYLKKIVSSIKSNKEDIARPIFIGLEPLFGISINFNNIVQLDVSKDDIDRYLNYLDFHQRIYNLVNLYIDKLIDYPKIEEKSVDVWFVVISENMYKYGRPKIQIPKSNDNIRDGLSKNKRHPDTYYLFPADEEEFNKLEPAYNFEKNFHHQLKARLLPAQIITQIIREHTIAYEDIYTPEQAERERISDSAKAWNIATTLYYKLGGIPWKLGDIRPEVCYLGFVYKKTDFDPNNKNACCATQMFLDDGDGMVFKGNVGPWWNEDKREYHLSKQAAEELITQSLEAYNKKFNKYPKEVFIHAKTYFDDMEWSGFETAAKNKSSLVGIRIDKNCNFKLYRAEKYGIPRGIMLPLSRHRAYLWTQGFIPRIKTQLGLETPNPIEIRITRGQADIDVVCRDILSLTKLNYNACVYGDRLPITLKFAEAIGEILTAGKDIQTDILTFKHYI